MSDFIPFVQELLEGWGPVSARRMFGGHGLYRDGLMFAIVMNQQLYLKADDQNRTDFEAAGLPPFMYQAKGRQVALSYHRAPYAMLDEPGMACEWAQRSWQAAWRAQSLKKSAAKH